MSKEMTLIPVTEIERKIMLIRGQKAILDSDLAALYGVTTSNLNKAVKRNLARFPSDFMFQLAPQEVANLIFQNGISRSRHGGHRKPAYAFTEQGIAMLSSVLRSQRAVRVNIEIMRAFVRLRQWLASNAELARKLADLEKRYDAQFKIVFDTIRKLTRPLEAPAKEITGFRACPAKPVGRSSVRERRARYGIKRQRRVS